MLLHQKLNTHSPTWAGRKAVTAEILKIKVCIPPIYSIKKRVPVCVELVRGCMCCVNIRLYITSEANIVVFTMTILCCVVGSFQYWFTDCDMSTYTDTDRKRQ